jgi:hypothetical protein
MTIEVMSSGYSLLRRGLRVLVILIGIVAGWIGSMAAIMWFSEIAPASIVLVSDINILGSLPPDIKIVRGGTYALILTSDKSGYVSDLYRAGAWLVLPSLRNGCLVTSGVNKRNKPS